MVAYQTDRLSEGFQQAMHQPAELVKEYPVSSMLVLFGVGLGIGLLVGQTLADALVEPEPTMTERMKRQVYDTVRSVLSPSMMRQIQNYTS